MGVRQVMIGSGPAAVAAAETIRANDPSADVTIIGAEPEGYYSRPGLAYYLAREVPRARLFPLGPDGVASLGARFVAQRATAIDRAGHRVILADSSIVPYDRLLLATGSTAIGLRTPGHDLQGVVKLDDVADARDLVHRSARAHTAVVVGGGITALEIVEGLRAHRVKVHYLMRRERYWADVLSEAESRIVERGLRARGVEIHYSAELAAILGRNDRVAEVQTATGERIGCEIVAVAVGVRPAIGLAQEAGLECERGVLVDQYLRTSDPDIFAAGDIAEVCDPVTGERDLEILWNTAVGKGRCAGLGMLGLATSPYRKAVSLNVTRLAGFKITIIGSVGSGESSDLEGFSRGDAESWRTSGGVAVVETEAGGAHVRLVLGPSAIAGAVVMGDQALSFPLQELIAARVDVGPTIEALARPGAPVAELVESAWRQWEGRRA